MERHGNYGESDPSQGTFKGNGDLMIYIRCMLEIQQKQVEILHQGPLGTSQEYNLGTVLKFRKLQSIVFDGTEKPLDAEQWLIDTTDLMKATRVPEEC